MEDMQLREQPQIQLSNTENQPGAFHHELLNEWTAGAAQAQNKINWPEQESFFRHGDAARVSSPEENHGAAAPAALDNGNYSESKQVAAWITGPDNIALSAAGMFFSRRSALLSAPMLGAVGGISTFRDMRSLLNSDSGLERTKYGLALGADATILTGAGISLARAFGVSKIGLPGILVCAAGLGARALLDLTHKN